MVELVYTRDLKSLAFRHVGSTPTTRTKQENTMHKNEEGVYAVLFYDKHGRHLKDQDMLMPNLYESIQLGKAVLEQNTDPESFLVKRNVYNSIDHR